MAIATVNGVRGTLRPIDCDILIAMASKIPKGGVYAETGSYLGCSATLVALVSPQDAMVYCHDVWEDTLSEATEPPPREEGYFFRFYQNIRRQGLSGKVIPIRGDSSWSLWIHAETSIDLAFVDGDHSYQGVKADLEALWDKMKPGACILCHDCGQGSETLRGLKDFAMSRGVTEMSEFHGTTMKAICKDEAWKNYVYEQHGGGGNSSDRNAGEVIP